MLVLTLGPAEDIVIQTPAGDVILRYVPKRADRRICIDAPNNWKVYRRKSEAASPPAKEATK